MLELLHCLPERKRLLVSFKLFQPVLEGNCCTKRDSIDRIVKVSLHDSSLVDLDPVWADALHLFKVEHPKLCLLMLLNAAPIVLLISLIAELLPERWRHVFFLRMQELGNLTTKPERIWYGHILSQ